MKPRLRFVPPCKNFVQFAASVDAHASVAESRTGWMWHFLPLRRNRRSVSNEGGGIMILGMSSATSILVHVVISLVGIVAGLIVMFGMIGSTRMSALTAIIPLSTIL